MKMQCLLHAVVCVIDPGSVCLHPYCVNTGVGTASASHFLKSIDNAINLGIVDRLSTYLLPGHAQTLGEAVNPDHSLNSHKKGTLHGHQSHPTTTPDGDGVPCLDVAEVSPHISSRHGIGQEEHLFVT